MTTKQWRAIVRYTHLVVGFLLGAYVYLPFHLEELREVLRVSLTFVGVPVVVLTGLWMWQGPKLRRSLGRSPGRRPVAGGSPETR